MHRDRKLSDSQVGQDSHKDKMLTDPQSIAEYALIDTEKAYAIWRAQNGTMPSAFQQVPHKPGAMEAELVADLQQEPVRLQPKVRVSARVPCTIP